MAIMGRTVTSEGPEARASDGDLTGDEYMALVTSKDVAARAAAAGRLDAPLGALLAFAQDAKVEVRMAVASNLGIGRTTTVIAHLSGDKSADVVRALIDNPEVSEDAVGRIAENGPRAVREYARTKLG